MDKLKEWGETALAYVALGIVISGFVICVFIFLFVCLCFIVCGLLLLLMPIWVPLLIICLIFKEVLF